MLSSSKSCNPPGALAAECHVWKSPTEGESWYARLGLSAKDNSHGVMTYGCERSKSTKQLYFMLMQGQVFHSPFLLQTHPGEVQTSKQQGIGAWLTQWPTTWNHLCVPSNVHMFKAQQRIPELHSTSAEAYNHILKDLASPPRYRHVPIHVCASGVNADVTAHKASQFVFSCTLSR